MLLIMTLATAAMAEESACPRAMPGAGPGEVTPWNGQSAEQSANLRGPELVRHTDLDNAATLPAAPHDPEALPANGACGISAVTRAASDDLEEAPLNFLSAPPHTAGPHNEPEPAQHYRPPRQS